jgi:hypothetical protein
MEQVVRGGSPSSSLLSLCWTSTRQPGEMFPKLWGIYGWRGVLWRRCVSELTSPCNGSEFGDNWIESHPIRPYSGSPDCTARFRVDVVSIISVLGVSEELHELFYLGSLKYLFLQLVKDKISTILILPKVPGKVN